MEKGWEFLTFSWYKATGTLWIRRKTNNLETPRRAMLNKFTFQFSKKVQEFAIQNKTTLNTQLTEHTKQRCQLVILNFRASSKIFREFCVSLIHKISVERIEELAEIR
jgi:hypothetical protein